jgi:hypothetical protein
MCGNFVWDGIHLYSVKGGYFSKTVDETPKKSLQVIFHPPFGVL